MPLSVTFPSAGLALAGELHLPAGPAADRAPAVVVGHPGTAVKEQAPTLYARRLAEHGIVALTFDAAYQGESEGEPHGLEDPFHRAEDFRNAVSYLAGRAEVDPDRIGLLGICASGGYVAFAAQTDLRVRAVAGVSAAQMGASMRAGDPDGWRRLVEQAGRLRSAEAAGAPAVLADLIPDTVGDDAPRALREYIDYYKSPRGHHPRATNRWVVRSADQLDQFDALAGIAKIAPRPLMMVAGSEAETLPFSRAAVEGVGASGELVVVDGATHVDLYDRDHAVGAALSALVPFLDRHLAPR